MTPYRHYSKNKQWTQRIRRGGLYVAVAAILSTQIHCGSNNGSDWEEVTTYEMTKGVVTTLQEGSNGEYTVIDEQVVNSKADSRIIVKRLNGAMDTLNLDQATRLVNAQDTVTRSTTTTHTYHSGGGGLGHIIWWSAMGYMMGRNVSSPSPGYVYGGGYMGGSNVRQNLQSTAIARKTMVPSRGRTGFFRGSSRASGRG